MIFGVIQIIKKTKAMKKIMILFGLMMVMGCESSEDCHCEVFENIGTEEQPQLRYIGSLDGHCDEQILEDDKVYQSVNCE